MNRTHRMALEKAFPPEERDAMTAFVIDNRPVLNVLQAVLEHASNGVKSSRQLREGKNWLHGKPSYQLRDHRTRLLGKYVRQVREQKSHLLGGHEQVQILLQIATENGFNLEQSDRATEIILFVPGQDLTIRLECDIDIAGELAEFNSYRDR